MRFAVSGMFLGGRPSYLLTFGVWKAREVNCFITFFTNSAICDAKNSEASDFQDLSQAPTLTKKPNHQNPSKTILSQKPHFPLHNAPFSSYPVFLRILEFFSSSFRKGKYDSSLATVIAPPISRGTFVNFQGQWMSGLQIWPWIKAKPWFHQYLDPPWYHLWRALFRKMFFGDKSATLVNNQVLQMDECLVISTHFPSKDLFGSSSDMFLVVFLFPPQLFWASRHLSFYKWKNTSPFGESVSRTIMKATTEAA